MITLKEIPFPEIEHDIHPVTISDESIAERKANVLNRMAKDQFDALILYADLEHGGNYEYQVVHLPRFEEALLILHKDVLAYLS